jgi:hypothetical protein
MKHPLRLISFACPHPQRLPPRSISTRPLQGKRGWSRFSEDLLSEFSLIKSRSPLKADKMADKEQGYREPTITSTH